jgi:predicted RNA-binding Zn-ribbon protein involved in translation (DUF1610 family)
MSPLQTERALADRRAMTIIRATCPACGEVDLAPEEVFLDLRATPPGYGFDCPRCGGRVRKTADRIVAAMLLSAGVTLGDGRPAVPSIPERSRHLPAFAPGDVVAFRRQLADDVLIRSLSETA